MIRFYQLNLIGFAIVNGILLFKQYTQSPRYNNENQNDDDHGGRDACESQSIFHEHDEVCPHKEAVRKFIWDYFPVYALAVAADWIQASTRRPGRLLVVSAAIMLTFSTG